MRDIENIKIDKEQVEVLTKELGMKITKVLHKSMKNLNNGKEDTIYSDIDKLKLKKAFILEDR